MKTSSTEFHTSGLKVSSEAIKSGSALSLYRLALVFDKPSSELTPEDFSFLALSLSEFDAFHFGKMTNKTFSELTLQDFIFLRRILNLPSLRVHHSVVGRLSEFVSDEKLGRYKLIDLFCLLSAQCTADGSATT